MIFAPTGRLNFSRLSDGEGKSTSSQISSSALAQLTIFTRPGRISAPSPAWRTVIPMFSTQRSISKSARFVAPKPKSATCGALPIDSLISRRASLSIVFIRTPYSGAHISPLYNYKYFLPKCKGESANFTKTSKGGQNSLFPAPKRHSHTLRKFYAATSSSYECELISLGVGIKSHLEEKERKMATNEN